MTDSSVIGDWPNTYTFTKAVTEDMIKEEARDLPIAILRPSIGKYIFQDYSHC
jgi:fatty acyl-CoA reductase